jgi:hypothetical protein
MSLSTTLKWSSKNLSLNLSPKTCHEFSDSNLNSNLGRNVKEFQKLIGQPRVAFGQPYYVGPNDALGWGFDH